MIPNCKILSFLSTLLPILCIQPLDDRTKNEYQKLLVREDRVFPAKHSFFSSLMIFAGVRADFIHSQDVHVSEILENLGILRFFCESCDNTKSTMVEISNSDKLVNAGNLVFDYRKAKVAPQFKIGDKSTKFFNVGQMWFGIGGEPREGGDSNTGQTDVTKNFDVSLGTTQSFQNEGYILLSGTDNHKLKATFKNQRLYRSSVIRNRGLICLRDCILEMKEIVRGDGCIAITGGSELFLDDKTIYDRQQIYYMDPLDKFAILHINVDETFRFFMLEINGFSKRCFIIFSRHMFKWRYDSEKGSLSFAAKDYMYTHVIKIGQDYNESEFQFDGQIFTTTQSERKATPSACKLMFDFEEAALLKQKKGFRMTQDT